MISLPFEYQEIRAKLNQYLLSNPVDAIELAIAHFEDYLALTIKYKELQSQPITSNFYSIPDLTFELPLEHQFDSERLKRHLKKYPEQAHQLAIEHHEDFYNLAIEYKNLLWKRNKQFSPSLSLAHF